MVAYVTVALDGAVVTNLSDFEIAAFCGDECRGVADVLVAEKDGLRTTYGYLRIRSNVLQGEDVTFRCYQKSLNKEFEVSDASVPFLSQSVVGMPSSPKILHLAVDSNRYSITFISDGDTLMSDRLESGTPIVAPEVPDKEGYTFTGWEPELAETMPAHDVTYVAVYEPNAYAIIYVVNGREWARDSLAYGTPIVLREYTPAEGEIFIAWYSDKEYETMPAYDITYRAHITTSGITEILKSDKPLTIYNIRGELIGRNIPARQIERLPRGIYIIDGKKVIVK
jgi:hypothetical protein